MRIVPSGLAVCAAAVLITCGDAHTPVIGARDCAVRPFGAVCATFSQQVDVGGTPGTAYFHSAITNSTGMQQAIDAWQGRTHAQIPVGVMVCQAAEWNCGGWVWHLDPSTVEVAETAIELCDGPPPVDQASCQFYVQNGGQFCPWGAKLLEVRDCRTDSSCPIMPR